MIKLSKIIACYVLVIGAFFSLTAHATAPIMPLNEQNDLLQTFSPVEAIKYHADMYNAPVDELLVVAKCESSYNPKAIGDGGRAISIFQYHKPTFIAFSKLMGETLDYYSYYDQSKLTAFIFANYPQYKDHWTCWTKFYK